MPSRVAAVSKRISIRLSELENRLTTERQCQAMGEMISSQATGAWESNTYSDACQSSPGITSQP